METKKEKKKGFWASLFSPKPCSCSGSDSPVVEEEKTHGIPCACSRAQTAVKEIKVLGPGCPKCKATYSVIERVVKASGLDVKLTKVDDIAEMMSYNIMTTPAVVVDGVVRLKGHVPTEAEVRNLLGI